MKRDSRLWWFVIAASVMTAVSTNLELVRRAFPGLTDSGEATIELVAMLVGIVAGLMRMSPLPLSDKGRDRAFARERRRRAEHP